MVKVMEEIKDKDEKKLITAQFIKKVSETISKVSSKAEKTEEKHSKNNIFYILGVQGTEIRHSNFLKWLMEKDKQFLQEFLQKACEFSQARASKLVGSKYRVDREYPLNAKQEDGEKSGRIDLLLQFEEEKVVVAIENKWNSSEGEQQLSKYYIGINNNENFENYEKKFVFLTPRGDVPKDDEDKRHYISVSYDFVQEILKKINISGNVEKILIKHYKEVLEEELVKNEKEIDKIEEYYKLFGGKKGQVMVDMAKYIPDIKKRAEIERDVIKNLNFLELKSEGQNTFLWLTEKEISAICQKNGLGKDWLEFCISNEPFNVMSMQFVINYDSGEKYKKFADEFREKFGRADKSKKSTYAILFTENLVVSNKSSGYLTEEELQAKIREELIKYFTDPNSMYFKILDFVRNYKF